MHFFVCIIATIQCLAADVNGLCLCRERHCQRKGLVCLCFFVYLVCGWGLTDFFKRGFRPLFCEVKHMRQLVIDQLSPEERANIESYLKRTLKSAALDGIFWLPVPDDLLGEAQQGHDACGPFYFGIELEEKRLVLELLVRSQSNLHCSCISYATKAQRDFLLGFFDRLLAEEQIRA